MMYIQGDSDIICFGIYFFKYYLSDVLTGILHRQFVSCKGE